MAETVLDSYGFPAESQRALAVGVRQTTDPTIVEEARAFFRATGALR